jgi:hypothetical protein
VGVKLRGKALPSIFEALALSTTLKTKLSSNASSAKQKSFTGAFPNLNTQM